MKRPRIAVWILVLGMMLTAVFPATALTSQEKEEQYNAAVQQLETYLESCGNSSAELAGIRAAFEELGGYEQSKFLGYYVSALMKTADEEYDYLLKMYLNMLEADQAFQDYLSDVLKGSPIRGVESLTAYCKAREYEHGNENEKAAAYYKQCLSFYDASDRYMRLSQGMYQETYDSALALLSGGDPVGAYMLFASIPSYDDSELFMAAIERELGYAPASPEDTLKPVTDLRVTGKGKDSVTLSWRASAHAKTYEVYFKPVGGSEWNHAGDTEKTEIALTGLSAERHYDFQVVAAVGRIKAEGAALWDQSLVTPSPTPTATPLPGISVEITSRIGSNRLSWNRVAGAERYCVYRGTSGYGNYSLLATVTDLFYTDSGVWGGSTYYYMVEAVFPNGQSVADQKSAVAATPTPAPTPTPTISPAPTPKIKSNTPSPVGYSPVDIGVPNLGSRSYSNVFSGANSSYDMDINIYWVQVQLKQLGYYSGDLSGLFDYNTDQAVRSFMNGQGKNYPGRINQEVVNSISAALGSRRVPVMDGGYYHALDRMTIIWSNINHDKYGSNPNTPYKKNGAYGVQYCLTHLGYDPNGIDGMFGEGTDRAVQRFESSNGFERKADRHVYVTYGEARKMLELCVNRGISVSGITFSN